MSNKIIIELQSKDKATGQIIASVKEMESGLKGLEATGGRSLDSIDKSFQRSIATVGKWAAVLGTASAAFGAMAFKKGIQAIDDFEQKTIGIAATLTNMAAEGQGSFKQMFDQNLVHAKAMYEELRKVDADRFSSLNDMMATYNILVQKGYAARIDEAKYIGIITDKIKLATQGQEASVQINQEIRALMDGQARAGSQIAQELEARMGPAWADIVKQHKEAGDLLQWMTELWPGIEAATESTNKTLEAQMTTLEGNLKYVGREGLAGAYEDIVDLVKQINEYLRAHGDEVAGRIARGWEAVRDLCQGIVGFIRDMNQVVTVSVKFVTSVIGPAANWLAGGGTGTVSDAMMGFGGTSFAEANRQAGLVEDFSGYETSMKEQLKNWKSPYRGQTKARPPLSSGGGGGGGKGGGGGGKDPRLEELKALRKETKELERDAAEAGRMTERLYESNLKAHLDYLNRRKDYDEKARTWTADVWQDLMNDERASYQERLAAAEQFKNIRLELINKEVEEIKEKYGSRISEDVLASYKKTQVDSLNKTISGSLSADAFSWESAWKRAAENVQDALGETIYNIITQADNGKNMLQSLFQGFTRMMSDMLAQALMGQAKTWLGGGGWGGGGGVTTSGGGFFGSIGSAIGDFFGSTGWFGAKGGVLPGGFTPIHAFANGGMVTRPTLGLIGEAGPEIVLPLDKYNAGGSYQISVAHNPVYNYRPSSADYERDAKMIVKALDKELRIFTKRSARNFVRP